jgi:hypothetical protein
VAEPPRTLSERAQPLLEEAAESARLSARARAERLRDAARAILQATLAAPIAWLIATEIVGHAQPFFAPVSAMITLGLTQGERGRRAIEVVLGVTLGIAIADLLVIVLGTGWWQLALVVGLAMSIALLLGSGQMFAQQAAVSAALVATLQPPDGASRSRARSTRCSAAASRLRSARWFCRRIPAGSCARRHSRCSTSWPRCSRTSPRR